MAVTVSGMFGNGKTYFAGSPVVIDISGLEWPASSPFNVVKVDVTYSNRIVGSFRQDSNRQSSISFDISSALQAIYYADTGENVESVEIGNLRYLSISNPNLRQRGLADQLYKEYSYWVRNARICRRTVHITMADLLKIDKTKRVQIADITGFIRKIQYTVDKKQGLGMVEFEIMYI